MEGRHHPGAFSWPALVFLAWCLGLLFLFWVLDPTENILIQDSPALANPAPLVGFPGLFNSLGGFLLGSLIVVSWLGFGTQLLCLLPSTSTAGLGISSRFAMGAGSTLILLFMGTAGWFHSWAGWLLILPGLGGNALELLRWNRTPTPAPAQHSDRIGVGSWVLLAILLVVFLTALLGALAPPVACDSLLYQPVPSQCLCRPPRA